MMTNVGQQMITCSCPTCGYQITLSTAPAWQGMQMPAGQMYGMAPGMMAGQGATGMPGMPSPGWSQWETGAVDYYTGGGVASDEELEDTIYDSLDSDPTIPAGADINVDVTGGVVTLIGRVPSKRIKHTIGDAAWWIPDVLDVNNQLEVQPRKQRKREQGEQQAAAPGGQR